MASPMDASLGGSCDAPDPISMDLKQFFQQGALRMLHTYSIMISRDPNYIPPLTSLVLHQGLRYRSEFQLAKMDN